jgi:hypothetical protein
LPSCTIARDWSSPDGRWAGAYSNRVENSKRLPCAGRGWKQQAIRAGHWRVGGRQLV